jgi:hypothetical protein
LHLQSHCSTQYDMTTAVESVSESTMIHTLDTKRQITSCPSFQGQIFAFIYLLIFSVNRLSSPYISIYSCSYQHILCIYLLITLLSQPFIQLLHIHLLMQLSTHFMHLFAYYSSQSTVYPALTYPSTHAAINTTFPQSIHPCIHLYPPLHLPIRLFP